MLNPKKNTHNLEQTLDPSLESTIILPIDGVFGLSEGIVRKRIVDNTPEFYVSFDETEKSLPFDLIGDVPKLIRSRGFSVEVFDNPGQLVYIGDELFIKLARHNFKNNEFEDFINNYKKISEIIDIPKLSVWRISGLEFNSYVCCYERIQGDCGYQYFFHETIGKKLESIESLIKQMSPVHDEGFIHTDLKPENFIASRSKITIIDWDDIKVIGEPREGNRPGTAGYCMNRPPEKYSPILDVHSLGIMTYEAFTGYVPSWPVTNCNHVLDMSQTSAAFNIRLDNFMNRTKDPRIMYRNAGDLHEPFLGLVGEYEIERKRLGLE